MTLTPSRFDRDFYILVVDDDNTLLKFFKIHLNKFFSKVIVVKNAKEAVDTIRERQIDLVITDINMPRMNGFQLLKRVRKHDGTIPVLLISGALLDEEEEELLKTADGYLRKPFDVDCLHSFIDAGLDRRDKMKKLEDMVVDKKHLKGLLKGTTKTVRVSSKEKQAEAEALLAEIMKVA